MAIYLGENGKIELARRGSGYPLTTKLSPADVNPGARRFSVLAASASLVTGDQIEIKRLQKQGEDTKNLELVEGHDHFKWRGYVNKDPLGGMRLYNSRTAAIEGGKAGALPLVRPSETQKISIETRSDRERCLAQIQDFEISTERETIDVTTLSQQFRNHYRSGLISGQGRINCFWQHTLSNCERAEGEVLGDVEFSAYLAHLCIRVQQGAGFHGLFYIYDGGNDQESVWYESDCIVTNVSTVVDPEQIIQSSIDFITTGPLVLKTGYEPSLLQQENRFLILQENGEDGIIASPEDR